MNRSGKVYFGDDFCGVISETPDGFSFCYDKEYLKKENSMPISLTMPLTDTPYTSSILFPFFDGLIPEGYLLEAALQTFKLSPLDRMGLLLAVCEDAIGAVKVVGDYHD